MKKLLGQYQNGNVHTMIFEDGTKIRETEDDEFRPGFAENMDIKISNYCDMGCLFCHEGSTINGKHGDIMNQKFIDMLHPFQEIAIGGGSATSHPDLIPFLQKLKAKQVIANMTVNQKHFEAHQKLIQYLVDEKLIYGIGISLVDPTEEFISLVQRYPNAVIHTINGILTADDVFELSGKGLKMLILGYKDLRRGAEYKAAAGDVIAENQKWLYDVLPELVDEFKVLSFDNLAIEQLDVKRMLTDTEWERFYAGNDGDFTFYVDMVEQKFARNSTASMNERYPLLDDVDEMFEKVRT